MPTARISKQPSMKSKPQLPNPARAGSTRLGDEIVKGLKQAAANFRGEKKLRGDQYHIPDDLDVRAVRRRIGLSQAEFAGRFALNPRTVQEWEQGRSEPE